LFIRCNIEVDGWPFFRPAHRVSGWVYSGNEVHFVPDQIMDVLKRDLKTLAGDEGFWRRYSPGEKVNVVSHCMQGTAVVLEESRSPESRVNVALEFMGRMVPTQVPWDYLRSIDSTPEGAPTAAATKEPRRTRGKSRKIRGNSSGLAVTH
jgi:transcription antitermination factor NusG